MSPDDAYNAAVHPDDRQAYDRASAALHEGRAIEVEYRLIARDGSVRWVLDRMRPRTAGDGRLLVGGVVADITDRKQTEFELAEANRRRIALELRETQRLAQIALHDALTGLPNRIAIQEHLDLALKRAERSAERVALMFIDLDNFKLVNDSFGHAAGDELLRAVATRLREAVRDCDVVARQGGDEFLILVPELPLDACEDLRSPSSRTQALALRVHAALRAPFIVDGVDIFVSASIGISVYPDHAADAMTLIKHADFAMYTVKEGGRNGHALYAREVDTGLQEMSKASRLRQALERDQGLALHYQPIVLLDSGEVVGVEALVRWHDGARGLIPPEEFIPLAERTGLIARLTDWVVEEACRQSSAWQQQGRDLYISLNVPPSYCREAGMHHLIGSAREAGIDLDRLMLEITESGLAPDGQRQMDETLAEMSRDGLKFAIDDFGTGYSSLGRLNNSWVCMLKVDRSFVQRITVDTQTRKLVEAVAQLARTLDLVALAEGVETEAQRRVLLGTGVSFGQGSLWSGPLPVEELEPILDGAPHKRAAA